MKSKSALAVLLTLELSFLTGCVGIVPVPPLSSEVTKGRKIERREVNFIVPGVTTRREVEKRLGPSIRHCDRPPAITYLWITPGWTIYSWWIIVAPSAGAGGEAGDFSVGGRHAFFVAFDDNGIVRQTDFVSLSQRSSLDDELEQWAKQVRRNHRPHATR